MSETEYHPLYLKGIEFFNECEFFEAHDEWEELATKFPDLPGRRTIIRAELTRIADSCGFGVPKMDYVGDRDTLQRSAEKKTEAPA